MLPSLLTCPKPDWKTVGPFLGPVIREGKLKSMASAHLTACHSLLGLNLDRQTDPSSFRVRSGTTIAQIWKDKSLLLGEMRDGAVAWHGVPLKLDSPFLAVIRTPNNHAPRKLTLEVSGNALVPSGPDNLVSQWDKTLKDAIKAWAQHLGPIQDCGSPDDGSLVSPSYPFPSLPEDTAQTIQHLFTSFLTFLDATSEGEAWVHLSGFTPSLNGWTKPRIQLQGLSMNGEHDKAMAWIATMLKHPNSPITPRDMIQSCHDTDMLLSFPMPTQSAHQKMMAHAYIHQTYGEIPKI